VRCVVDSSGTAAARIELESSIAGSAPVVAPAQDVAAAGRGVFDVPMTVPRELAIDSSVEIVQRAAPVTADTSRFRGDRLAAGVRRGRLLKVRPLI
jgi:hypothetical protein